MTKPKCSICGKPELDKEDDFCFGCAHVVCTDCCYDLKHDDIIGWEHNLKDHYRAFLFKVKLGAWVQYD